MQTQLLDMNREESPVFFNGQGDRKKRGMLFKITATPSSDVRLEAVFVRLDTGADVTADWLRILSGPQVVGPGKSLAEFEFRIDKVTSKEKVQYRVELRPQYPQGCTIPESERLQPVSTPPILVMAKNPNKDKIARTCVKPSRRKQDPAPGSSSSFVARATSTTGKPKRKTNKAAGSAASSAPSLTTHSSASSDDAEDDEHGDDDDKTVSGGSGSMVPLPSSPSTSSTQLSVLMAPTSSSMTRSPAPQVRQDVPSSSSSGTKRKRLTLSRGSSSSSSASATSPNSRPPLGQRPPALSGAPPRGPSLSWDSSFGHLRGAIPGLDDDDDDSEDDGGDDDDDVLTLEYVIGGTPEYIAYMEATASVRGAVSPPAASSSVGEKRSRSGEPIHRSPSQQAPLPSSAQASTTSEAVETRIFEWLSASE